MSFAISRAELESTFGAGDIVTVARDRMNPVVTHEDTARFLSDVGLPNADDFLFMPDDELGAGMSDARERVPSLDAHLDAPGGADAWTVLGFFWDDFLFVDGRSGQVWVLNDGLGRTQFANSGIDLFAAFLAVFHGSLEHLGFDRPVEESKAAVDNLTVELRALDPAAFADPESYWYQVLERVLSE